VPPATRRLFYAFWPDDVQRQAVETARKRLFPLSGRPVAADGLHVTAAFLGAVSESRLGVLLDLCGPVPPLTITFDRLEHWARPRVLVAATTHLPDDLRRLVDELWRRLDRLGFPREARPYRPHVTLARDIRSVRHDFRWQPLAWPVDRLELVESVPGPGGSNYRPVGRPAVPG